MRLIMIDDDADRGAALAEALELHGHQVDRKHRGSDLLLAHHGYHAVILDLTLPDMDGLQALRKLREVSSVPVVLLAEHADERSIVLGLHNGADDYLVKPARVAELAARLEAVTRRVGVASIARGTTVISEDVRVDLAARRVEVAGQVIPLTRLEFELLRVLAERPGIVVSREQLMDCVWGNSLLAVSRKLYVHMASLRAKLDRPELITNIRGYGYRWGPDPYEAAVAANMLRAV
ncbi:response regulator transcription factor [Nocardia sp. NBC_00565]|uniref:response regulator transcription factor n=1 Tax=Nocardia sp. NBC_00565 TaxID=2975993 RepID=UPI002E816607|nr:response regulator transcription factor [Nocardia sp. NBC_00565]WUC07678.1 response regulator transcription factor [Nocardia sp. NBC_00565]